VNTAFLQCDGDQLMGHGRGSGLPPQPPPSRSALAWCAEPATQRWFCIRLGGPSSTESSSSQHWSFSLVSSWSRGTQHRVIDECRCCWPPACKHSHDELVAVLPAPTPSSVEVVATADVRVVPLHQGMVPSASAVLANLSTTTRNFLMEWRNWAETMEIR
jgi:hypothetical protein